MQKSITVLEKENQPRQTTGDQLIILTCHLFDATPGANSLVRFDSLAETVTFEQLLASFIVPLDPAITSVECQYQNMHRELTITMVTQRNFLDADVSDAQALLNRAVAEYNQSL